MEDELADLFHTYYQSPVGRLHISGTESYISRVTFSDAAPTEPGSRTLPPMAVNCVDQLIAYFNGACRVFELPLHQDGTIFQKQTWNFLSTIPFGKTISYLQLAQQGGDPKATRAVANANSRNNIAIIVPCHRVIGSSGALTGYAGGLWRKKWLLAHEMKHMHGVQTLFETE